MLEIAVLRAVLAHFRFQEIILVDGDTETLPEVGVAGCHGGSRWIAVYGNEDGGGEVSRGMVIVV